MIQGRLGLLKDDSPKHGIGCRALGFRVALRRVLAPALGGAAHTLHNLRLAL